MNNKKNWTKPTIENLDSKFNAGASGGKAAVAPEGFVTASTPVMIMFAANS